MKSIRMTFVLTVIFCGIPSLVFAEDSPQALKIQTGFMKGQSYSIGNQPKQSIYQGMKLNPEFAQLLSVSPKALQEAKKSTNYLGLTLLGEGVVVAGAVMSFMDTLDQKKDVEQGNIATQTWEANWTSLYVTGAGVVLLVVANNLVKKHLNNAESLYNKAKVSQADSFFSGIQLSDSLSVGFGVLPQQSVHHWKFINSLRYKF